MLHPKLVACGVSSKYRLANPSVRRAFTKPKQEKELRQLQVGKGAQRRVTDAEMAEREAVMNADPSKRPKRVTPLKIAF
jgi:hypothetical protein